MAKTPVGMFGLGWEEITEFAQKTDKTRVYLDDLKKEFIYWFDGGGALTKRVAHDCADFIRSEIYSQNAFEGMPDISETWRKIKKDMGLSQEIGIATGDMARSIKPISQKYNRYKVGISSREHSISPGNITSVAAYAKRLEYGTGKTIIGSDGKRYYQPPRPFFSKSFMQWVYRALPGYISKSIHKSIYPKLLKIYTEVADNMPNYDPEDYYWISHGKATSEAQETFQESMQQGTSTFGEDIESSEMQVSSSGVVGRSTEEEASYGEIGGSFPESKRTSKYEQRGDYFVTETNYIWNQQDKMWQDSMEYFQQTGRFPEI